MEILDSVVEQIRNDWMVAPYGGKTFIVKKWAKLLDCSQQAVYRALGINRERKGERKIKNIEDYARIVAWIKRKPPANMGEVPTDLALRKAIKDGFVPDTLSGKENTIDRVTRELGLTQRQRRIQRYQAERPNQLHHVDASSSRSFFVAREIRDKAGNVIDYALRLHAAKKGYKNKPVPIRMRPWIYGLVDDYSGFWIGRYVAAMGESAVDNLDFLRWAWSKNEDTPFFGLPEMIKGDLGPMMRGPASQEFFERLNMKIDPSMPENKESHGKIERPWRTAWQRFESTYFMQSNWRQFEIMMSELNRQFFNYQEEYNTKAHRYEKKISRLQAWRKISLYGGAVAIPEAAFRTIFKRYERVVGADGCISVDNVLYEVKGLHSAQVNVYEGVFEDRLIVEDKATGEKYEVEDFRPNPLGVFTGHKETPHQKAVKAAQELKVSGDTLYSRPKDAGNVAMMPTRVKRTVEVEDPLCVDAYGSLDAALRDFAGISGLRLDDDNREAIRDLIIDNGLKRDFVKDLALEFVAENERRLSHG